MLSKEERKTVITFSEDKEEAAEVYTHNPILRARLAYMAAMYPQEVRWHSTQYDLAEGGERYIVSREWMIRALKGIKPERQPSAARYTAHKR